jgi:hypothetical protein
MAVGRACSLLVSFGATPARQSGRGISRIFSNTLDLLGPGWPVYCQLHWSICGRRLFPLYRANGFSTIPPSVRVVMDLMVTDAD